MSSEYLTASEAGDSRRGYSVPPSRPGSSSNGSSSNSSRRGSAADTRTARRGRVRFNSTSEANDPTNQRTNVPTRTDRADRSVSPTSVPATPPSNIRISPPRSRDISPTSSRHTPESEKENPFLDAHETQSPIPKPRPSVLRNPSSFNSMTDNVEEEYDEKAFSALAAQERAQRIASLVGSHSAPASRRGSLEETDEELPPLRRTKAGRFPFRLDDIPLTDMDERRAAYDRAGEESDEGETKGKGKDLEARNLVRSHSRKYRTERVRSAYVSGTVTPTEEQVGEDYVPRPKRYRPGILSNLLKLYNQPASRRGSEASVESPLLPPGTASSVGSSGTTTPRQKWYHQRPRSEDTLSGLIDTSSTLAGVSPAARKKAGPIRPGLGKRTQSGNLITAAVQRIGGRRSRLEEEIRITIHIAEILSRQKYLLKLCRALMSYGAPTHRLEEYMKMSARVLETEGQFLYIPGCMIISFDDASTHTTEVKLVKSFQGVDLGKLKDVHQVYKEVVHDVVGVEEATHRLDAIINAKQKFNNWFLVLVYGFASATVAPYGKSGLDAEPHQHTEH